MSYDFSDLSILLVDDNQHMRKLIREILFGFNIRQIRSYGGAEEVMQDLDSHNFDLAIIDWQMQPINGIDLVKWIRTSKKSPDHFMPIIMVTGHSERHRVEEARDVGVNEFLVKPLSGNSIYGKLSQIVDTPRHFVQVKTYFGPDRRRRNDPELAQENRRRDDPEYGKPRIAEDAQSQALQNAQAPQASQNAQAGKA